MLNSGPYWDVFMATIYGRSFVLLTVASWLALTLTGCQDYAPDKKDEAPASTVMFVKGNPDELIRGATLQKVSPFTEENISMLNSYSLMSMNQFPEKEKAKPIDTSLNQEKLQNENESKDISTSEKPDLNFYKLKVEKGTDGFWHLYLLGGVAEIKMVLGKSGRINPVEISSKNSSLPVETLHWSQTPDRQFISLLVRANEVDLGKNLISFIFEKTTVPEPMSVANKKYIYLAGPGNKIPWKNLSGQSLTIGLCGAGIETSSVERAVNSWGRALEGRMKLKFERKYKYAPFSDLNEHCVSMVNAYIYESRSNMAVYGVTLGPISLTKNQLVDSDVFLFQEEFNKNPISGQTKFYPAMFHELGHLLGLGHKFDGTASVMSYQIKDSEPQVYDIEALSELYPKEILK